jgi:hypothetical protein
MIRIAILKKENDELHMKAFSAEGVEDAKTAACEWVAKNQERNDDMKIVYPDICLAVIEYFITHNAVCADPPVVHSRVLSDEDRKFLTDILISMEDSIRTPCCGMGQHPAAVSTTNAIQKLEERRDEKKPRTRRQQ